MRRTRKLLLFAGLAPVAVWWLITALGWGPDAQVLSGTMNVSDPVGSAARGLLVVGTWLTVAITGPPLIGGSLVWMTWERLSDQAARDEAQYERARAAPFATSIGPGASPPQRAGVQQRHS